MKKILHHFCQWLNASSFPIQPWTNEKTIQNQLGLFLNYWLPRTSLVELEVNVMRLPGINSRLRKKEADIVITNNDTRSGIEVKYWKDPGTYNIGMFRLYEDVCFVEQLCDSGFATSGVLFLTDISEHYTKMSRVPTPKNPENSILHTTFRYDQCLQGTVRIKTGGLDDSVTISNRYPLCWRRLRGNTWYVVIEIGTILPQPIPLPRLTKSPP